MTSRITRTTITLMSVGGLFLLGMLICSLYAGRVNAQRIYSDSENRASSQFPVINSPQVFNSGNQYQAIQPSTGSFDSGQPPRSDTQSYGASSAALTQPIVVAIKEGPQLRGEPVELGVLNVKTIFGPVSIPVDRIAGVRTADDSRQPATICLTNGDSLTGVLATNSITIKTEWGTATIDRDHIVSIVTSTDPVTWQQHEGRWRIVPVEPAAAATETADSNKQVGEADFVAPLPQVAPTTPATLSPTESEPTRAAAPSLN